MIRTTLLLTALCAFLTACGGGGNTMTPPGSTGPKPIDPSGNWTMTAKDSNNNTLQIAALFNQVGSTVTANSVSAAGSPNIVAPCVPFSAALSNGTVQNVSTFSGTFGGSIGSLAFTSTLNQAGTHFDGTYSGVSSCAGVAASGTFTGDEVPSTSGNWTGSIQPCNFNGSDGSCPVTGSPSTVSFALTQNDSTGDVTGTYSVTNLAPFTTGNVAVMPGDILSGLVFQFTMTDNSASRKFISCCKLALDRSYSAVVTDTVSGSTYQLSITH